MPDPVLVLREERLRTNAAMGPIGVAMVKKTVVTEMPTIRVEVRREEGALTVHLWPGGDEDAPARAHVALPELVLYEEEVVTSRRLVPRERVRLMVGPVTKMQADVHHEAIDVHTEPSPHATDRSGRA